MIPTEKIEKITFKKFVTSIGNLPSSYVESLSYYECILWLCNYLQTTVIPAVNNNGAAVEELQNLFIELKEYVDTYLSDEHLQPLIDEKLDEMAEDGSLTTLLTPIVSDVVTPVFNEIVAEANEVLDNLEDSITENLTTISTFNSDLSYIHISIDDVTNCLNDLYTHNDTYTSIFDNVLLNYLKSMHDQYNAKFSLYVFADSFANLPITNKYLNDFKACADWLKIGFHAYSSTSNFADISNGGAATIYNTFISNFINRCGSLNSLDRCPRLANFAGNIGALCALRDSNGSCLGFLTTDDERSSYYFGNFENNYINKFYNYFDPTTGLFFVKTIKRLENMENITTELTSLIQTSQTANSALNLEVFTHESDIVSSGQVQNDWIEKVCQFARNFNIKFDFLQNKIQNNISLGTAIVDKIKFFDSTIEVVQDPTQLDFKVGTLTNWLPDTSVSNNGRCVATKLLQVPYNSQLNFTNNILGYSISYALVEYGGHPISESQLDGGEQYSQWLTNATKNLINNTKFLQIVVKKTDGSTTDFTTQELAQIGSSFTIS